MKKNYNNPATEVVALAGMGMLMASDPSLLPNPNNNDPSTTGGDPIGN